MDIHLATGWQKISISLLVILSLSFVLITRMPQVSGSEMVMLKKQDSGKEIIVPLGAIIQIELAATGSTGYIWQFDALDPRYFEVIKTETECPHKPGFTGGICVKHWQLKTKQRGQADLQMYYFRPWEGKDKAMDKFAVKVRII